MLLAPAICALGPRAAWAYEPPDPRMLLDLDLFVPSNGANGANTSMLEQIRTLRAMGYLNGTNSPAQQPVYNAPPPPPPPPDSEDDVSE